MKRGEIWTMAGGSGYTSKPRPAVIVQEDGFSETLSIAVCPLISEPIDAPILRILVEPTPETGLRAPSRLMVNKVTTVPRRRFGQCIGRLAEGGSAAAQSRLAGVSGAGPLIPWRTHDTA